jgi:hypothetical protein
MPFSNWARWWSRVDKAAWEKLGPDVQRRIYVRDPRILFEREVDRGWWIPVSVGYQYGGSFYRGRSFIQPRPQLTISIPGLVTRLRSSGLSPEFLARWTLVEGISQAVDDLMLDLHRPTGAGGTPISFLETSIGLAIPAGNRHFGR